MENGIKKSYKHRNGTVALREIRNLQKSTNLLLREKPFVHLVREIAQDCHSTAHNSTNEWRFKPEAVKALQDSCEDFFTELDKDSKRYTFRANRIKLQPEDRKIAVELSRDDGKMHATINRKN